MELEENLSTKETDGLPACLDGSRARPPEDCGGPEAYIEMNRNTRGARKLGSDPEHFDASDVVFDDPTDRWHWSFNAAVLLDNELRRLLSSPPAADRHGRFTFRVPLMCRDKMLDECFLDSELHSRFKIAPVKNGEITVKLDKADIENLLGLLAAAANHAKKRFDQMVFRSLCGHLSTCSSILAKKR